MKLEGRRWIVKVVMFKGHFFGVCLHEWGRVQCTLFQSWRGNVWFAGKILEWRNSSKGEEVLIYAIALYSIIYRMLVWCQIIQKNSVVCFRGLLWCVCSIVECLCRKPNWWLGISLFISIVGRSLVKRILQRFWKIQWGRELLVDRMLTYEEVIFVGFKKLL
jgi:hypothetical protein